MADFCDIGSETTERCNAEAIQRQVGKSAPESHPDFDGLHCVDCDDEIPARRLAMWKVRCVGCQGALESLRARGLA